MTRRTGVLCALVFCAQGVLAAQQDSTARPGAPPPPPPPASAPAPAPVPAPMAAAGGRTASRAAVHYGKWAAAAAAVAFTALGAHEHDNSNRLWNQLLALCVADNAECALGPDGRYLNPVPEALYQSSVGFDRRARTRLLLGQAALVVAAGCFILDLKHATGPGNIPFAPLEVSVTRGAGASAPVALHVGMRLAF